MVRRLKYIHSFYEKDQVLYTVNPIYPSIGYFSLYDEFTSSVIINLTNVIKSETLVHLKICFSRSELVIDCPRLFSLGLYCSQLPKLVHFGELRVLHAPHTMLSDIKHDITRLREISCRIDSSCVERLYSSGIPRLRIVSLGPRQNTHFIYEMKERIVCLEMHTIDLKILNDCALLEYIGCYCEKEFTQTGKWPSIKHISLKNVQRPLFICAPECNVGVCHNYEIDVTHIRCNELELICMRFKGTSCAHKVDLCKTSQRSTASFASASVLSNNLIGPGWYTHRVTKTRQNLALHFHYRRDHERSEYRRVRFLILQQLRVELQIEVMHFLDVELCCTYLPHLATRLLHIHNYKSKSLSSCSLLSFSSQLMHTFISLSQIGTRLTRLEICGLYTTLELSSLCACPDLKILKCSKLEVQLLNRFSLTHLVCENLYSQQQGIVLESRILLHLSVNVNQPLTLHCNRLEHLAIRSHHCVNGTCPSLLHLTFHILLKFFECALIQTIDARCDMRDCFAQLHKFLV